MGELKTTLARNLKFYRELRGLTQRQLAEKIGTPVPNINRFEKGQNSITSQMVERLATALGVEETDLFYAGEPPKPIKLKPDLLDAMEIMAEMGRQVGEEKDSPLIRDLLERMQKKLRYKE